MFNSYEELMEAVDSRRNDRLVLEVDLGGQFSQEHEDAKKAYAAAKAMQSLAGEQEFLTNNLEQLQAKVEATRPASKSVWLVYSRVPLMQWATLMKKQGLSALDQYEEVLPNTFVGVYGQDPDTEGVEPLSTDYDLISSKNGKCILPGNGLHHVMQAFMTWQNSGGDVRIRPTKSGQD